MSFKYLWPIVLFSTVALSAAQSASSSDNSGAQFRRDMVHVLTHFAHTCKVPMLIEVAEPFETDVEVPPLSCDITRFLTAITTKHPSYSFAAHGRAVHFYKRALVAEKNDFLNWKFQNFVLPRNVAEFKNVLAARLGGRGRNAFGGGLVVGLLPNDLLKRPLPNKQYVSSSARDILLDVQDMDGSFYNVVVFPKQRHLDDSDIQKAFASWQWRSIIADPVGSGKE
jgi:hypothetical protein